MIRRAFLGLALVAAGCGGDPCDGQSGACLTISFQGDVGALDTMQVDLASTVDHRFTKPMPDDEDKLPVQVGVLIPDVTGEVIVRGVALRGGATVGVGSSSVNVTPGAHLMVTVMMSPTTGATCSDGYKDGNEADVDCGGSCARCLAGRTCTSDNDCLSGKCDANGRCHENQLAFNQPFAFPVEPHANFPNGPPVVVGDFNGDGKPDLVAAGTRTPIFTNISQGVINLLSARGRNAFAAPNATTVGTNALLSYLNTMTTADFDGDTKQDIVALASTGISGTVCNFFTCYAYTPPSPPITGLLGRGDGSFTPAAGTSPFNIFYANASVADFDLDGILDLALADRTTPGVAFRKGRKDGTFDAPVVVNIPSVVSIVSGDWNSDTLPDVAALQTNAVTVLVSKGETGTFAFNPFSFTVGSSSTSLAASDVNRDGKLDLVVGDSAQPGIRVLLAQPEVEPYFATPTDPADAGGPIRSLVVGDWNDDGKADVIAALQTSQMLALVPGNGDGTFASPTPIAAPELVGPLVLADLDGDHRSELVAAMGTNPNAVAVYPSGILATTAQLNVGVALARPPTSARLNNDAYPDLVFVSTNGALYVALNNGDGTFAAATSTATGITTPGGLALGDLNDDGNIDAVVGNATAGNTFVRVLLGNGNGSFQSPTTLNVGATPAAVAIGDISGDGQPDVVTANTGATSVSVLVHNPSNTAPLFAGATTPILSAAPQSIAIGDVTGDGTQDIVVTLPSTNSISVLDSHNSFQALATAISFTPRDLLVADLNGDQRADVATANTSSNVTVLLSQGGGLFQPATYPTTSCGPQSIATADFDLDGHADLVVGCAGTGMASILLGSTDATFQPSVGVLTGLNPMVGLGDWNGDGKMDFASANISANTITVVQNMSR